MNSMRKLVICSLFCLVFFMAMLISNPVSACGEASAYGNMGPAGFASGYGMGPGSIHGPGQGGGPGAGLGGRPGMNSSSFQCQDRQRGLNMTPPYIVRLLNNEELELTEKQIEKLKKLQVAYHKDNFDTRCDLQIKKMELKKLRFGSNPSFEKISKKQGEISAVQLTLQNARTKLGLDADNLLTEEQKNLLYVGPLARMPNHGLGRGQGFSRMPGYGPGQGLGMGQGPNQFFGQESMESMEE